MHRKAAGDPPRAGRACRAPARRARVELARALNGQGEEASSSATTPAALAAHEEARALAEPLATGPGATIEARRALGFALHRMPAWPSSATGKVEPGAGGLPPGPRGPRGPWPVDTAAVARRPPRPGPDSHQRDRQACSRRTGDMAGALAEQRQCQELLRALVAEPPPSPTTAATWPSATAGSATCSSRSGDTAGRWPSTGSARS